MALHIHMKDDSIMEIIEDDPRMGRRWWYIDIVNMTSSIYGQKDEAPCDPLPPHAINNVRRKFLPKVGLSNV